MSADISQKEVHWQRTKSLMIVHLHSQLLQIKDNPVVFCICVPEALSPCISVKSKR